MTFKPAVWYPIAVALSVFNFIAIGFTAGPGQPLHAGIHAALGLGFGFWAQRLRPGPGGGSEIQARLETLELEVSRLRQEVSEAQERLDFAERLLARGQETRREGPAR